MALVPNYNQRMRPAGPSRILPGGPIYDQGLAVWSQLAGSASADFARRNQAIRQARMSIEANDRAANFSVGLDEALTRAQQLTITENGETRIAEPEDQEAFFSEQVNKLVSHYGQMPKADVDVQAGLHNKMVREVSASISKLRNVQLKREMENIAVKAAGVREKALQSGNRELYEEALNDLVKTQVITTAARDKELAGYEAEKELTQSYMQLHRDPATVAQRMTVVLDKKDLTDEQRRRALSLLSRAQEAQKAMEKANKTLRFERWNKAYEETLTGLDKNDPDLLESVSTSDVFDDQDKAMWTRRIANRQENPDTDPVRYNQTVMQQLQAIIGQVAADQARDDIAKARYDDLKLSHDDYQQVRSLGQANLSSADALRLKASIETTHNRAFIGWLPEKWQGKAPYDLAHVTNALVDEVVRLKQEGKPIDAKALDALARRELAVIRQPSGTPMPTAGPFGGAYAVPTPGSTLAAVGGRPTQIDAEQWGRFDDQTQQNVRTALGMGMTWDEIREFDDIKPLLLGGK